MQFILQLMMPALVAASILLLGSCASVGAVAKATAASSPTPISATATKPAAPPASTPAETPTPAATVAPTTPPSPTPTPSPWVTQPPAAEPSPTAEPPSPIANVDELAATGEQLYKEQYCGICHELDAVQSKGLFGPPHNDMAAVAAQRLADPDYSGQATTPAEYIRESIVDPPRYFVPSYTSSAHPMPAYTHLSDDQIEALVQFLSQQ